MLGYVCKNCGKYISIDEYTKLKNQLNDATGCGCLIWLVIILFCCSVILIPIAIILVCMLHKNEDKIACPYCETKDCLIPLNTPVGEKTLKEYYTEEEIENMQKSLIKEKKVIKINKMNMSDMLDSFIKFLWKALIIIVVICVFFFIIELFK